MRKILVFLIPFAITALLIWGLHHVATAEAKDEEAFSNARLLNAPDTVIVSGTIRGPGGGVPGVVIHIISGSAQQTATTNASGFYSAVVAVTNQITFKVRPPQSVHLAQINHLVEDVTGNFTQNFDLPAGNLLNVLPVGSQNEAITRTIQLQTLPLQEDRSVAFWWYELDWDAVSQRYQAMLPQDIIYVKVYQTPTGYHPTLVPFDLRSGDFSADIPLNTHKVPLVPSDPPDAARITTWKGIYKN